MTYVQSVLVTLPPGREHFRSIRVVALVETMHFFSRCLSGSECSALLLAIDALRRPALVSFSRPALRCVHTDFGAFSSRQETLPPVDVERVPTPPRVEGTTQVLSLPRSYAVWRRNSRRLSIMSPGMPSLTSYCTLASKQKQKYSQCRGGVWPAARLDRVCVRVC